MGSVKVRRTRFGWRTALLCSLIPCGCICPPFCDDDPPPPPPPFELTITEVSNPTPALNESYSVRWRYSDDERLADQFVETESLTLSGGVLRRFFGCPPPEFRPPGLPDPADCGPEVDQGECVTGGFFTDSCREFAGTFTSPVRICVTARDQATGSWVRKSVVLRHPASSHFTVGDVRTTDDLPFKSSKGIEFTNFWAIRNSGAAAEIRADGLLSPRFGGAFSAARDYFATSLSPLPAERFGFSLGALFPALDVDFLRTADGQAIGARTNVDAVVVAATILVDGAIEVVPVKTAVGEAEVPVVRQLPVTVTEAGSTVRFFPQSVIFVSIDLADADPASAARIRPQRVCNARAGNLRSGLVMPTFGGGTPLSPGLTSPAAELVTGIGPVGASSGQIGEAGIAFMVTDPNFRPVSAVLTNISWSGVPVFPDDQLELMAGVAE